MCITVSTAKLSGTKIYVGEAIKDGKYVHVIAYQNNADSDGPNAMILPFPTNVPMGPENAIDTREFKNFLNDICDATKIRMRSMLKGQDSRGIQSFDIGSYSVILTSDIEKVSIALKKIHKDKRPQINMKFLLQYGKLYPNQSVAVCCWNGKIKPEPLLWWYEPRDKENFFIPTMDAHDGNPPDPDADVQTDHIISIGSTINSSGSLINYTQDIPREIRKLLPNRVYGYGVKNLSKNGDMFVSVEDIVKQNIIIKRGLSITNFHYKALMNGWTA